MHPLTHRNLSIVNFTKEVLATVSTEEPCAIVKLEHKVGRKAGCPWLQPRISMKSLGLGGCNSDPGSRTPIHAPIYRTRSAAYSQANTI